MVKKRSDADRRIRQADRMARMLRVLQLIQGRGRWNAKNIGAELECSERTVYRDLTTLELAGVPWRFDKDENCYRVRPDFRFPVLNLSEEELLGQAVATAATQAPGLNIGLGAKPTTRKLAVTSNEAAQKILADAEQLVSVLDLKLADHARHLEIIQTIQWGLLRRKQLVGQYHGPYQVDPVSVRLHPYRLCLVKQAWYLIGRPTNKEQPRTYRVARFKALRMVDEPAVVPEEFDLKAYFGNAWAVYRGDTAYQVEIAFTKEAASLVTETIWHQTQEVRRHKDGSVILSFQVDGLSEILWWVLSWAGRAKVVQPDELRELVVEQLRKALDLNKS